VELPSDGPAAAGSSNGGLLDKMAGVPAETVEMICGFTGMDEQRVRYALVQCSGDADRAAEWLFSHMDDNIDIAELGAQDAASAVNAGKTAAGGAPTHAGSARFRLKALVCHEGASTLSGHYVAYVHHGAAPTDAAAAGQRGAAVRGQWQEDRLGVLQ
jgi:ubiquitin carboxyl-terminal hydrolase 5/13